MAIGEAAAAPCFLPGWLPIMGPVQLCRPTNVQASRRAFFGIRRAGSVNPIRPPWAISEADFVDVCTRCSACVEVCPTDLLVKGSGGFPEADFTPGRAPDGCTFCGKCLESCRNRALLKQPGQAAWTLKAVFGEDCLAAQSVVCRTCGEVCETGAIRFPPRLGGVSLPQLDADACTGCGVCQADCPTVAIRIRPDFSRSIAQQGAA
jgi:ferredoxin-type protein NapF